MPDSDGLDALRHTNPRHQPAYDDAVAAIAAYTREVLAAAAVGAGAGAVPSALRRVVGGPRHRGRQWLAALFGVGAGLIAIVLVATGTISWPRSTSSHVASPSGTTAPGRPAEGATGTGTTPAAPAGPATVVAPATAITTTAATTTSVPPPVAHSAAAGAGAVSGGTGTVARRTTVASVVPPTTAHTTTQSPVSSPPTAVSAVVPTCAVSPISRPPAYQSVSVLDAGSGLASITNIAITNGTVRVPHFAPGTRSAVVVVASKTDPSKPTIWSFDATDLAGHTTHCA